jgi:hypothetical protein
MQAGGRRNGSGARYDDGRPGGPAGARAQPASLSMWKTSILISDRGTSNVKIQNVEGVFKKNIWSDGASSISRRRE